MQVISIFQEMSDANKCFSNDMRWILIVEIGSWGVSGKMAFGEEREKLEKKCRGLAAWKWAHVLAGKASRDRYNDKTHEIEPQYKAEPDTYPVPVIVHEVATF